MKRYVILSTNDNPDYEFYIPLATWAWNKIGWDVVVLKPFPLEPYREETITQVMRLYAGMLKMFEADDLIMTSDADMIPMVDYWNPKPDEITIYGHDLTNYIHVPICYIAMNKTNWQKVMNLNSTDIKELMHRDLEPSNALSSERDKWWGVDQDIITERLSHHSVTKIDRGTEPGSYLPLGRLDRAGMKYPKEMIDFHAPRQGWAHIDKIKEALLKSFDEFPEWLDEHVNKYTAYVNER